MEHFVRWWWSPRGWVSRTGQGGLVDVTNQQHVGAVHPRIANLQHEIPGDLRLQAQTVSLKNRWPEIEVENPG